jgi:type IV secretory pathway protease TraF
MRISSTDVASAPVPPLEEDEVFLATEREDSFDSRHFGPVVITPIRGKPTAS